MSEQSLTEKTTKGVIWNSIDRVANYGIGFIIGNNVMVGLYCFVLSRNHRFDSTDIPMRMQGYSESNSIIIYDVVWRGRNVTFQEEYTSMKER